MGQRNGHQGHTDPSGGRWWFGISSASSISFVDHVVTSQHLKQRMGDVVFMFPGG